MKYLSLEQVAIIHSFQQDKYNGMPGIRSQEMLESAVYRPQASFDGSDLYNTIFEKAASLMHSLIKNHPFVDGNKRTGILAAIAFLESNGFSFSMGEKELVEFTVGVASGGIKLQEIAAKLTS